ncbi:MAG TPA: CheR family methyltransferase [Bryobacteraceae bacterium]|nr:CheR family methyltransferase [Bryobacteraceae bacterium]
MTKLNYARPETPEQVSDYTTLKEFVIQATGLSFYETRDPEFAEIVERRLGEAGCRNYQDYLVLLQEKSGGNPEMDRLIGQLTIGETYFFRHTEVFDVLETTILPQVIDRNQSRRRLNIWSAGCSNGAEAYSIALLLDRAFGDSLSDWQVSIVGTDINRGYLTQAREGRFAQWAFRSMKESVKNAYFSWDGSCWAIHPSQKRWVTFQHHNLVETPFHPPMADIDIILCRNVTIYFANEVTRRVVGHFHECLNEDGWLLVGHVEPNLDTFRSFRTVNFQAATCYQKSREPATATALERRAAEAAPDSVVDFWLPTLGPLLNMGAPVESGSLLQAGAAMGSPSALPELDGVRSLANGIEAAQFQCHGQKPPARPAVQADGYFYRALELEQLGQYQEAQRCLQQAIYMDRKFILAHYHLGLLRKRENNNRQAAQSFGNVLKLLRALPPEQQVAGSDGMRADELCRLADAHLTVLADD